MLHIGLRGTFQILLIVFYSCKGKEKELYTCQASNGFEGVAGGRVVTCCVCVLLQEALKVMEFTEEEVRDVFKLLSAVLQMGNIEFMTAGGAQITSKGGRRGIERSHQLCHAVETLKAINTVCEDMAWE